MSVHPAPLARRPALALALTLAGLALAAPAGAQVSAMAGAWRGLAEGVTFNLVVQPNGAFSEQQLAGRMMTLQSGHIAAGGPGLISFVVEDWSPRTMPVYHPTGTVGGYYTQETMARPTGGAWRIRFNGPDSMTLVDANLGGAITFLRQR